MEEEKKHSLEMLKSLQKEYKSISDNPELKEIKNKLKAQRKNHEKAKNKQLLEQELMQQLRQKFQNSLNKLNSIDTREIALREAKTLIERNNSLEALRIYISSLAEHRKAKSPAGREQEVLLLGFICQVYSERMIGDQPNPLRLLIRIAEVIQVYFKDLNRRVHSAAADALCLLYKFSLPKDNQEVVFTFMFEPLNSILSLGIDVQAQQAAALAIFKWASLLREGDEDLNLATLYNRTLGLFVKLRPEFPDLVSALGLMIEKLGFQPILDTLIPFLNKLVQYLLSQNQHSHYLKTETCKLLVLVSKKVSELGITKLGNITTEITNALKSTKMERFPAVQSSVREALKAWEQQEALQIAKKDFEVQSVKSSLENLPQFKAMPKALGKRSKSNFQAARNLLKLKKEENKEFNWGINKEGFLKRGSGNYAYVEGGKVDFSRAIKKRPSVREFIKRNHSCEPSKEVEIFFKDKSPSSEVKVFQREEPEFPVKKKSKEIVSSSEFPKAKTLEDSSEKKHAEELPQFEYVETPKNYTPRISEGEISAPRVAFPQLNFESQSTHRVLATKPNLEVRSQAKLGISPKHKQLNFQYQGAHKIIAFKPELKVRNQTWLSILPKHKQLEFQSQETLSILINHKQLKSQSQEAHQILATKSFVRPPQQFHKLKKVAESGFAVIENQLKNSFYAMDSKLHSLDERIEWATETVSYLKEYKEVSKHLETAPQPLPQDLLVSSWNSALTSLQLGDFNSAYQTVLATQDDIYLLRLVHKTGPCLELLETKTAKEVLEKLCLVLNSEFIQSTGLEWIHKNLNLIKQVPEEDKTVIRQALNRMSQVKGEQGEHASYLFSLVSGKPFIDKY